MWPPTKTGGVSLADLTSFILQGVDVNASATLFAMPKNLVRLDHKAIMGDFSVSTKEVKNNWQWMKTKERSNVYLIFQVRASSHQVSRLRIKTRLSASERSG